MRGLVAALLALVVLMPDAAAQGQQFSGGKLAHPRDQPTAEPSVVVDGGGTLWITAFAIGSPNNVTFPGTGVWRSTNAGRSFSWVDDPIASLPYGGDSDIAAATARNPAGLHNVYATALGPLSVIELAVSPDGGESWSVNPAAARPGPADRPWVAASGACVVHLVYEQGGRWLVQTYDTCSGRGELVPSAQSDATPDAERTHAGKPVVDNTRTRWRGTLYVPLETCSTGCRAVDVVMAISRDGGATWRHSRVARKTVPRFAIWSPLVATDEAGGVYAVWHDDHDSYLASSRDGGASWSRPVRLNAPGTTAVYPAVAGGRWGRVDVAWYGTTRDGDANSPSMGPPGGRRSAPWRVVWATSADMGRTFRRAYATGVVHTGIVCTRGGACNPPPVCPPGEQCPPASPGARNLFDVFGIVIHPRTQRATIAYTTDQPGGTLADDSIAYATQR